MGLLGGLAEGLGKALKVPLPDRPLQSRGGNPARVQQQPFAVDAHGLSLQQGLEVVVVVLDFEHIHHRLVGDIAVQVLEQSLPLPGQGLAQLPVAGGGKLTVPDLLEHLSRLVSGGCIDHALHPGGGEQVLLPGPEIGGNKEIIGILQFLLCQKPSSFLLTCFLG